ncbi:MAG: EAL domain-containing protein [Acidobacteriota bacterium]
MQRLLVVDDELANRIALSRRLERRGYAVDTAQDATEALGKIRNDHYDLVLLDQRMPGMTGLDLLKLLRATYSDVELPVIMVTAADENNSMLEALSQGANDFVVKPLEMPEMSARIQVQLSRAKAGRKAANVSRATRAIPQAIRDAPWHWDPASETAHFSQRWAALLGYSAQDVEGGIEQWLDRVHSQDLILVRNELNAYLTGTMSAFYSEHRLRCKDGHYRWVMCRAVAEKDPDGRLIGLSGFISDIDGRKTLDALTGLGNRLYLLHGLAEALSSDGDGATWMVVLLDIEDFAQLNEHSGHEAADRVLVEVAARLRALVANLANSSRAILARAGADEFVIAVPCGEGRKELAALAEAILACFDGVILLDAGSVHVTASIGAALSFDGGTPGQLLRDAELAMRKAREKGRHCWHLFEGALRDQAHLRTTLARDLRYAVDRNQLVAVYQPKVDLHTGAIAGFEALLRWRHPELGLVSPADFIPLAEETGLILQAGEWILREACRQLKHWQTVFPQPLAMSVNLSARQLCDPDLVGLVSRVIAETGLTPSTLHLELTESALIEKKQSARLALDGLHGLGVGLMLDDFGTGYAGLSYLNAYDFDALKIDRSFVSQVEFDSDSRAIIKTILGLAGELQMDVVAEGIETTGQLLALRDMGCRMAQGFLFSKPVEAALAEELMRGQILHHAPALEFA